MLKRSACNAATSKFLSPNSIRWRLDLGEGRALGPDTAIETDNGSRREVLALAVNVTHQVVIHVGLPRHFVFSLLLRAECVSFVLLALVFVVVLLHRLCEAYSFGRILYGWGWKWEALFFLFVCWVELLVLWVWSLHYGKVWQRKIINRKRREMWGELWKREREAENGGSHLMAHPHFLFLFHILRCHLSSCPWSLHHFTIFPLFLLGKNIAIYSFVSPSNLQPK